MRSTFTLACVALSCAIVSVSPAAASVSMPLPRLQSLRLAAAAAPGAPAPSPATPAAAPPPAPAGSVLPVAATTGSGKFLLAYHGQSAAVARYENGGSITVSVNGMKMTLDVKETDKSTIIKVDPSGNIVMKHETESSEMSMNGHVMPASDDSKESETVTIRPDGSLVSFASTSSDKDTSKTDARLFVATQPVFPARPLTINEKWSHDYAADSDTGLRAAHADFQLLGAEKLDGIDTLKIRMDYHETEGADPLSAIGTLSIERSTGDSVADDFELTNLPFPGGPPGSAATAKLHSKRIAGSPVAGTPADLVKTDPNRMKSVDEVVKDYQKIPGLFTLWRKTEAGRDTVYMEIREDQLEKLMLLEVTASTGTGSQIVAGDPIDDILFKFVKRGDQQLLLVAPNYKYTVHNNPALERAIRRSFADSYLESFKIEAKQPDRNSLLINVTDLFQGNLAQITDHLSEGSITSLFGGGGGYGIDREKTYISSIKGFPENIVIQTAYNFTGHGSGGGILAALAGGDTLADSRSMPVLVDYTVFELKDTGYMPRLADPRVGYFTNGMMWSPVEDFSDDSKQDSLVHYVYRWPMEKANPAAALSPPKQPIVFWLDNAIPVEYRSAVREGILLWNRAFEKIGIRDAIVVKQMPDDADWDHADMRHNIVRWVLSPDSGYAVSLFRVNPLTGQILNADITIDANMVRFDKLELQKLVDPATAFSDLFARPQAAALALRQYSPVQQTSGAQQSFPVQELATDPRRCTLATEAVKQAWFGETALNLLTPPGVEVDHKAYVHAFLRSVVAHEMGHCLGLRHNFIASTRYSLKQLQDPALIRQHGTVASVMDYVPFNIAAIKHKGVPYWTPTIGDYDLWAIEYGYRPLNATTPQAERPALLAIASQCNQPGLAYQSDEAADSWDPAVTRFDLGNDSIAYWQRDLDVTRELLRRLGDREPKKGESYWTFTQDFLLLLRHYAMAAAYAGRSIGGLHLNANFRGDAGQRPTLTPVPAAEQKKALGILRDYIFAENALAMPKADYGRLANNPYPGIVDFVFGPADYPVENMLSSVQRGALSEVFDPGVLTRIANNEYKIGDPKDELTLPTVYHTVTNAVWSELQARRPISALRRELQRAHLSVLEGQVLHPQPGTPDDAAMLAWESLRELRERVAAARQHFYPDQYTRIHLDQCLMRIDRDLNARVTLGDGNGGGGGRIMFMGAERSDIRSAAPAAIDGH